MLPLFPDIKPYAHHRLAVDPPHDLYVEECGNPEGIPVLFVHGGPGAGCSSRSRCFFNPDHYRVILFDQRGAGRSTPHAELTNNTTAALIEDIERIRCFLGIEQWCLFGGSWGATLSLLYAQAYPQRVLGLILRGVFLCRSRDIDWFYRQGASSIFPDYWQQFSQAVTPQGGEDLIAAYHRILNGNNELARMSAAKAWSVWEARCATLRPNHGMVEHAEDPHLALAMAMIESHFFINQGFIEPDQIIRDAAKLAGIPGIIVHGRYDMICPLENAASLNSSWPDSELNIIRDAGHSAWEPGTVDALVRATQDMARLLRPGSDELP